MTYWSGWIFPTTWLFWTPLQLPQVPYTIPHKPTRLPPHRTTTPTCVFPNILPHTTTRFPLPQVFCFPQWWSLQRFSTYHHTVLHHTADHTPVTHHQIPPHHRTRLPGGGTTVDHGGLDRHFWSPGPYWTTGWFPHTISPDEPATTTRTVITTHGPGTIQPGSQKDLPPRTPPLQLTTTTTTLHTGWILHHLHTTTPPTRSTHHLPQTDTHRFRGHTTTTVRTRWIAHLPPGPCTRTDHTEPLPPVSVYTAAGTTYHHYHLSHTRTKHHHPPPTHYTATYTFTRPPPTYLLSLLTTADLPPACTTAHHLDGPGSTCTAPATTCSATLPPVYRRAAAFHLPPTPCCTAATGYSPPHDTYLPAYLPAPTTCRRGYTATCRHHHLPATPYCHYLLDAAATTTCLPPPACHPPASCLLRLCLRLPATPQFTARPSPCHLRCLRSAYHLVLCLHPPPALRLPAPTCTTCLGPLPACLVATAPLLQATCWLTAAHTAQTPLPPPLHCTCPRLRFSLRATATCLVARFLQATPGLHRLHCRTHPCLQVKHLPATPACYRCFTCHLPAAPHLPAWILLPPPPGRSGRTHPAHAPALLHRLRTCLPADRTGPAPHLVAGSRLLRLPYLPPAHSTPARRYPHSGPGSAYLRTTCLPRTSPHPFLLHRRLPGCTAHALPGSLCCCLHRATSPATFLCLLPACLPLPLPAHSHLHCATCHCCLPATHRHRHLPRCCCLPWISPAPTPACRRHLLRLPPPPHAPPSPAHADLPAACLATCWHLPPATTMPACLRARHILLPRRLPLLPTQRYRACTCLRMPACHIPRCAPAPPPAATAFCIPAAACCAYATWTDTYTCRHRHLPPATRHHLYQAATPATTTTTLPAYLPAAPPALPAPPPPLVTTAPHLPWTTVPRAATVLPGTQRTTTALPHGRAAYLPVRNIRGPHHTCCHTTPFTTWFWITATCHCGSKPHCLPARCYHPALQVLVLHHYPTPRSRACHTRYTAPHAHCTCCQFHLAATRWVHATLRRSYLPACCCLPPATTHAPPATCARLCSDYTLPHAPPASHHTDFSHLRTCWFCLLLPLLRLPHPCLPAPHLLLHPHYTCLPTCLDCHLLPLPPPPLPPHFPPAAAAPHAAPPP